MFVSSGISNLTQIGTRNHSDLQLLISPADDHTQYLNNTRHDITARHTLGTVVPFPAFTQLTDTPGAYAGNALKVIRVNAGAAGIEYAAVGGVQAALASTNTTTVTNSGADVVLFSFAGVPALGANSAMVIRWFYQSNVVGANPTALKLKIGASTFLSRNVINANNFTWTEWVIQNVGATNSQIVIMHQVGNTATTGDANTGTSAIQTNASFQLDFVGNTPAAGSSTIITSYFATLVLHV